MNRKQRIIQCAPVATGVGLEIGPLHDPVVDKTQGRVFYLDHTSTADLRIKYDGQIPAASIHEVDYVCPDGSIERVVADRAPFDYVVASHVIEHVPDLIGWFHEIAKILKLNDLLCLAVPDRRYTFDYLRSVSTTGEILDAHLRKAKVPTTKHVYDHFTKCCFLDEKAAWRGTIDPANIQRRHPPGLAMQFVKRALECGEYFDCHCWVFTPESFMAVLCELMGEGLVPFAVKDFCETQYDQNEFFVTLARSR
jgi:2-polyprenyl-3-methyl-5-hydroxy-6-metoxy-1,4-benzoquinol methylase